MAVRVTRWCALEARGCPERNFNSVSKRRAVGSRGAFQGGPWRPLTAPLERERERSELVWGWRCLEEGRRRKPGGWVPCWSERRRGAWEPSGQEEDAQGCSRAAPGRCRTLCCDPVAWGTR